MGYHIPIIKHAIMKFCMMMSTARKSFSAGTKYDMTKKKEMPINIHTEKYLNRLFLPLIIGFRIL
jgi:hypothetical protein